MRPRILEDDFVARPRPQPTADHTARASARMPWRRLNAIALASIVLTASIPLGLHLRRLVWDRTTSIRFFGDIGNGYNWGCKAADTGIVKLYDDLDKQYAGNPQPYYALAYCPGRLMFVMLSAKWPRTHF